MKIFVKSPPKLLNPDGKARRSVGKTIVLASNYGMSGAGAGALMGKTAKEGTEILEKYFKMFPGVSNAIECTKSELKKTGYVSGLYGRRRRLPDINLKPYEAHYKDESKLEKETFNPFISCQDRPFTDRTLDNYIIRANACRGNKEYEALAKEAATKGIILQANTGRIAQAERQCFNSRIQGSAGTLTKKAMIDIFNDKLLKEWDAKLIVTVHDEVLVECKAFYADEVAKRLPELMINAAQELGINQPKMKCDPYSVTRWYSEIWAALLKSSFQKKLDAGVQKETAIADIVKEHTEFPKEAIIAVLTTDTDELIF